jgi:methylmalonyl-CoA epimerase
MTDLRLDHLVIAVRDLDAATDDYTQLLGRAPSWRGSHPAYGTRNTLFRIENTYVELLALGEGKPNPRWAGELSRFLKEHGEGLYAIALGVDDVDATAREMRRRGLEVIDPADGSGGDETTGAYRAWRNAQVRVASSHGVRLFFIQHHSPAEALPVAQVIAPEPKAAVRRMDHLVVLSAEMEIARQFWGQTLEARLALDRTFPERNSRILFFRLGDITVEISGGAVQTKEGIGKPDRLWGVAWGVDDVAATCERLAAAGIDASGPRPGIKPGTLVATTKGPRTHGVATLLIEHTAESFQPESRLPQGAAFDNTPERRAFTLRALDHVVLAAQDADAAAARFRDLLGLGTRQVVEPDGTHMRIADIPAGNCFVEVVQPLTEDHRVARWLAERGGGMFSISLEVDSIDAAVADLRAKGMPVSDVEAGVWAGTRVGRINRGATSGVSIQLIERA